ncbi:MAG: hypothetical protein WBP29_13565 [Candidatus Zixiibacteriota bacterium]
MELKFSKSADQKHQIKLESSLVYAEWTKQVAYAKMSAGFEVGTLCVGDGAPVKIAVKSDKGKTVGKAEGTIFKNKYRGAVAISDAVKHGEMISFEAQLPSHGLKGESFRIMVLPEIKVSGLKWGADIARRGDFVSIKADIQNAMDDTDVLVTVYEYDNDGAHDKVIEIPARVKAEKLDILWEYLYIEDTDDIATDEDLSKFGGAYRFPEYFFTITIGDTEIGKAQESGLLKFKDHIDLFITFNDGTPLSNRNFVIALPDGTSKDGALDDDGRAHYDDVPPGPYKITIQPE